jgi:hypothetical protein
MSTGPLRRGRVQLRRPEPLQLRSQGARSPAGHLPADRHPVRHPPQLQRLPGRETGSWSDHALFACLGVPIAYVEATNFTINGEDGLPVDSPRAPARRCGTATTTPARAPAIGTARPSGAKIWHTEHDRLDKMAELFQTGPAATRGQYRSDDPLPQGAGALTPSMIASLQPCTRAV